MSSIAWGDMETVMTYSIAIHLNPHYAGLTIIRHSVGYYGYAENSIAYVSKGRDIA